MNYYNDNDKGAVKWIKYLIKNKLIPDGEVDDRDIREIKPSDLEGFIQHHFFCGIAGWPYALRLAGWPEDRPVFTGSCPCQPFSVAGKGAGVEDERHLWPAFRWLIAQYRPGIVFGEQVSGKAGREWFDGVSDDLEAINYEVGAADLPACSVGAPHIRQRLWWVAQSGCERSRHKSGSFDRQTRQAMGTGPQGIRQKDGKTLPSGIDSRSTDGRAAHAEHAQRWQETTTGNNDNGQDIGRQETAGGFISCRAVDNRLANAQGKRQRRTAGMPEQNRGGEFKAGCGVGNADSQRSQKRTGNGRLQPESNGTNPWQAFKLADCRDGKQRRIPEAESAFPVVADGLSGRVALLRGIGNSIVPQVAAEFIRAFMDYEKGSELQ